MTGGLELVALEGTNPLGFLAALGVLDVLHRAGRAPTLHWTDDLVPTAVVRGAADRDDLVELIDADRERWSTSPLLSWPPGEPLTDAKLRPAELRSWFEHVGHQLDDRRDADLLIGLVAEGGLDNEGKAKPTHLHFTAGQQQFLSTVRELAAGVDGDRIREALFGPWRYDSTLKSLGWDSRGERLYALRATDPSKETRRGIPGADWLAFLGLGFFPVAVVDGRVVTTACHPEWKRSAFRWPLWGRPADRATTASLVADPELVGDRRRRRLEGWRLHDRGILRVLESPIRRSDQGGYGSFGAPTVLADALVGIG